MSNLLAVIGLGGGEIILILALILIVFGARHDQQNWFRWNADWANLITIMLLSILGMVILSLLVR